MIVGAVISYYLNYKINKKEIVYNVILEQYKEFIKLKEKFNHVAIDIEIYQLQDVFNLNTQDRNIIIKEMDKTLDVILKSYKYVGNIKKHILNNQYILQNNDINIESIILLHGYEYKDAIYEEINNYKYMVSKFNKTRLIENQNKYATFINDFSELIINIKVDMEKILFKEKICDTSFNKIKRFFKNKIKVKNA